MEKKKKVKKTKKVKIITPPPSPPSTDDEELSTDSSIDSQDYECPPLSDDEPEPMPSGALLPEYPENYHTDEPEPEPEKKRKRKIYR